MTTGTRTVDLRASVSGACGSGLSGMKSVKTWNGADDPAPLQPTYYKPEVVYELIPDVTWGGERVLRKVRVNPIFTRFGKPPKRARRRGEHAYSMSFSREVDTPVTFIRPGEITVNNGHTNFCGFGAITPPSAWTANDQLILVNKLRTKLVGDDFDVGVFLAELPQAAKMIANAALRINSALNYARKGQWNKAEIALVHGRVSSAALNRRKGLASNWLELQYGWKPLLSDAYAGAQMLAHMTETPFSRIVRAGRDVKRNAPTSASPTLVKHKKAVAYEGKRLKAIITEVNVATLTGLINPETIIWEKLPWSFVVDWFIPIGNYLSARGVQSSVTGTFVTSHKQYSLAETVVGVNGWRIGSNSYSNLRIDFNRSISTTLDVPLPAFKPLKKVASWMHMANAVALLSQRNPQGRATL